MNPNPVLKKLGLSNNDRVVIVHIDDVGMCQASVDAYADLAEAGVITCGAVMVPCGWAPAAAEYARNTAQVDFGIHATLTSEWSAYRWRPLSTADPETGMFDEEGFFHRRSEAVQEKAAPEAVRKEMEAQILWALNMGIKPTHLDTHMGTVAHPRFMQAYLETAVKFGLAPMMLRLDPPKVREMLDAPDLDDDTVGAIVAGVNQLEDMGIPLLDDLAGMPLDTDPAIRMEQAKTILSDLKPGVTHFLMHPAKDTPELRAITPDWACRVADYETFMQKELITFMKNQGIHAIGYKDLQALIPR